MSTLYIANLLEQLPQVASSRMVHTGLGVWVAWSGQLDAAFNGMLEDYGGFRMAEASGQSLWYFFGEEGLRSLARLYVWGRVNALPVFVEVFPASMVIGIKFEKTLTMSVELSRQHVTPGEELEILVHPNLRNQVALVPGVSLTPTKPAGGLARVAFEHLEADPGLRYETGLNWLGAIKPLGDPLSRTTAEGWRNIAEELLGILERLRLKFMRHEGFLIFEVSGLRGIRAWSRETSSRIAQLKEEGEQGHYWPSVMAVVTAKGRTFGKDLPRRLGLDWDKLAPDLPHMSYRSAFLLGDDFNINEARYLSRGGSVDDWCTVSFHNIEAEEGEAKTVLAVPLPAVLSGGDAPVCFYCGLNNHEPAKCPSKRIDKPHPEIWERFAGLDTARLEEVSQSLETALAADLEAEMLKRLSGKEESDILLRAIFESDMALQFRMLEMVWYSKAKEMPPAYEPNASREGDFFGAALQALRDGNEEQYEGQINQALTKYPRAYQPKSVQALRAMETGDWTKAVYYWQEAGRLCYTALQRGYFLFLQARALEVQGDNHKAIALYQEVLRENSKWKEPVYRRGVCLVKMGFTDQAMQLFSQLIVDEPSVFNRVMVDPELERGRLHVLAVLSHVLDEARQAAVGRLNELAALSESLHGRFLAGEPYVVETDARIQELAKLGKTGNYVAFMRLGEGVGLLHESFDKKIETEIKTMLQEQARQFEELKSVQREAAWFPFPALLKEFNRDFNFCATKLNWMRTTKLSEVENFHRCREYLPDVDERIRTLRTRLITLRIVRDSTFFTMLLGRNFLWMEVVGLGLSLVIVPLCVYGFQRFGQGWVAQMMEQQKWQLQKGLVIILTIAAMALAAINTALTFESKKRKLFKLAEEGKLPAKKAKPKKKPKPKKAKPAKPKKQ